MARPLTLPPKDVKPTASAEPAAWWKLDETGGADAADASSHYLKASVQGQPRWAPGQGKIGGALAFDGRTFVDCGDAPELGFHKALTVSLWLKSPGFKKTAQTLIAKGSDTWRLHSEGEKGQLVWVLTGLQTTGKDKGKPVRLLTKRSVASSCVAISGPCKIRQPRLSSQARAAPSTVDSGSREGMIIFVVAASAQQSSSVPHLKWGRFAIPCRNRCRGIEDAAFHLKS